MQVSLKEGQKEAQNEGEKAGKNVPHCVYIERKSEERNAGEQSSDNRGSRGEEVGERPVEADSNDLVNNQASQWLKAVLPEMTSGWWDVYPKGRGFAVKFCWRDPERQTLTFPRISHQQLHAMRQSASDETEMIMREQIFATLRRFLIDPDKRGKAMLVAQKLGIDPDDLQ